MGKTKNNDSFMGKVLINSFLTIIYTYFSVIPFAIIRGLINTISGGNSRVLFDTVLFIVITAAVILIIFLTREKYSDEKDAAIMILFGIVNCGAIDLIYQLHPEIESILNQFFPTIWTYIILLVGIPIGMSFLLSLIFFLPSKKYLDRSDEEEQYLRSLSQYMPMSELELARAKERESFNSYRLAEERVSSIRDAINRLEQQHTSMSTDQYKAEHERLERKLGSAQESLQLCKKQWEEDSSNPLL